MKSLDEIKRVISEHRFFVEERFKVKSMGVFGSYLRGEENEESDIDILVEFDTTPDLLDFVKLENFLSDALGFKVDLVMKDSLKRRIRDGILREAVDI